MTKHSFVVLRLSRYFLSHAQSQPYVLRQGCTIGNPLQKPDNINMHVPSDKNFCETYFRIIRCQDKRKKERQNTKMSQLVREFTRS